MAALDWQKATREQTREGDSAQTQAERMMLTDQWEKEAEREKQAERDLALLNRERNLELIKHNEAEKRLREQAEEAEKQRDKAMLGAALNREKQLQDLEEAEKLARRMEVMELQ